MVAYFFGPPCISRRSEIASSQMRRAGHSYTYHDRCVDGVLLHEKKRYAYLVFSHADVIWQIAHNEYSL